MGKVIRKFWRIVVQLEEVVETEPRSSRRTYLGRVGERTVDVVHRGVIRWTEKEDEVGDLLRSAEKLRWTVLSDGTEEV